MPRLARNPGTPPRRQRGATLVMGLIFLVLLTLLGVAAMNIGRMEERMSGNTRDRIMALNTAEAALRDCERVLQAAALPAFSGVTDNDNVSSVPTTPGMYMTANANNPPVWDLVDWSDATHVRVLAQTPAGAATAPRCVIEELPALPGTGGGSLKGGQPLPESGTYRVTARGTGRLDDTVIVVQSIYVR